jgi:NADP-dependent 3-hydroxy acid dehydrogenase YdfG
VPRLKGAVVALTGASSGIGAAAAARFAARGAHLALCARRLDRLQSVAERCRELGSPSVTIRRTDVSRREECRAFIAGVLRDHERINVLVNNAGLGWMGRLDRMPEERVRTLVDTNVLGTLWTTQAALPAMVSRHSGVIVNVASVAGFRPLPYSSFYAATKHAVVGLSHSLRGELTGTGVKVTVIYPGGTESEFFAQGGENPSLLPVYPSNWIGGAIVRAARFPRRDVIIMPFRLAHLLEPVIGGPLDHVIGEVRRHTTAELQSEPEPAAEEERAAGSGEGPTAAG